MSYKRVNKPTARKMYNKGYTIKLLPCKVSESVLTGVPHDYDWLKPIDIAYSTSVNTISRFDRDVNNFEFYNCNAELGYYAHYYVDGEDYNKFKGGNSDGIEESIKSNNE